MSMDQLRSKLGTKRLKNIIHPSKSDGYVYISNPKAGCSTIKLYLTRCQKSDPEYVPASLHKRKHLPFDNPGKMNTDNLEKLFHGDYYVFSFVRHPLKRAVSAYEDKIKGNKSQKKEILALLGENPEALHKPVSFNEFVKVITSQKPENLNPHWRPQVLNLYPNIIRYDFIGHLETFDQDLEHVKKRLGLPDFHTNRQNVKSSRIDKKKLLTPLNRLRLTRLYAEDFVQFGYRPQGIEYLGLAFGYLPSLHSFNFKRFMERLKLKPRQDK